MSDVSWSCEVSETGSELTVGKIFKLNCSGAVVPGFNPQTLSLELPKPDRYRLRILENVKSDASSVELKVTSYMTGPNDLKDVVLSDGVHRISLSGIRFEVQSVLVQGEEAKPVPPFEPANLMWPTSAVAVLSSSVLFVVLLIAYFIQKARSRKQFKKWLAGARTPLSPFDQLSKDLRMAMKERNPSEQIKELERMTRVFLARSFEEPLMHASPKKTLNVIVSKIRTRDRAKLRERLEPLVIRLYGEFQRVGEALAQSQLSPQEAMNVTLPQVQDLVREFAEVIRREHATSRKSGA